MKFKKGDRVHLGHKKKGGAGVTGKITEIEDDKVFIVADDGREYRGQVKYLSKPANEKIMKKVYKYLNESKYQLKLTNKQGEVFKTKKFDNTKQMEDYYWKMIQSNKKTKEWKKIEVVDLKTNKPVELNEAKEKYFIEVELRDAKKALDILKDEKIKHKTDGTNKYLFNDEDEYFAAEDAFKRAKVKIDSKKEPK